MKKISSILLALTMLLALCVPAFAGQAVNSMTQEGGKQIASAIVRYLDMNKSDESTSVQDTLANAEFRAAMYKDAVLPAITMDKFGDTAYREASVTNAMEALKKDYALSDELTATMQDELSRFLKDNYVGVDQFDKDEIKDNVADNFTDDDLNGLFDTLRNTVNDLSGRVSGVFRGLGNGKAPAAPGADAGEQPEAGMQDPTGDTGVFAVLGVAAVAGIALIATRKKSSK